MSPPIGEGEGDKSLPGEWAGDEAGVGHVCDEDHVHVHIHRPAFRWEDNCVDVAMSPDDALEWVKALYDLAIEAKEE